jgi:hypothetical protein
MVLPTQMHNVLCRSVTIEARFTASSRSSAGSHRDWTDLYRASNSRVEERCGRRCMYRMGAWREKAICGFGGWELNPGMMLTFGQWNTRYCPGSVCHLKLCIFSPDLLLLTHQRLQTEERSEVRSFSWLVAPITKRSVASLEYLNFNHLFKSNLRHRDHIIADARHVHFIRVRKWWRC